MVDRVTVVSPSDALTGAVIKEKYKDMGDGTHAKVVSVGGLSSSVPVVTITSKQTSATGATFVQFPFLLCNTLDIVNTHPSAVDIEVRRGGSGYTIIVPAGSSRAFEGLTSADELQIRRFDQSNTQVTITAEAYA